jgi:hypothetical protein
MASGFYHTHGDDFFWTAAAGSSVGFCDETYQVDARKGTTYYALGAVLIYPEQLDAACDAILDANHGEPPHATELYRAGGLGRAVIEGRLTPHQNRQDLSVAQQIRATKPAAENLAVKHESRFSEPILCIADMLAWAFRQDHLGKRRPVDWYDPLRSMVHTIPVAPPTHQLYHPMRYRS